MFNTYRKPTHYVVKNTPMMAKKTTFTMYKGFIPKDSGYDQEIKLLGAVSARSFDEAVRIIYGTRFWQLKCEDGVFVDTDGKTIFRRDIIRF